MRVDLNDTTFIIPIRIDSIIRLENILLTIDNLQRNFNTNIVVLEAAPYNNGILESILKDKVTYLFIEDKDPIFYKTKYLNIMAKEVKTGIIGIWDTDIIIAPNQILESIQQIRANNCDIAYPYNGDFFDMSTILRSHYVLNKNIIFLDKNKSKMNLLYCVKNIIGAVGGAILANTQKYIYAGMENEEFYGWGLEDGERHYRWLNFGFVIYRNEGPLFHLTHPRTLNSSFQSKQQKNKAITDFNEIVNYTKYELQEQFATSMNQYKIGNFIEK